jgi:hypothetical protein
MTNGKCGLCETDHVHLVKSHIYPRWCTEVVQGDANMMFTVSPHAHIRPAPLHGGGEYDRIVCDACEQSFKAADDCFLLLYRHRTQCKEVRDSNGRWGVTYTGLDQALLQRFFLTCLFRAHLSQRPAHGNVDLGPYLARMRTVLLQPASIVPDMPVTIVRESHQFGRAIHLPHRIRFSGAKFWRLALPYFTGMVRIGNPLHGYVPMVGLALGRFPEVWMPNLVDVPPDLLQTLGRAKANHGDAIERLVAKATRPRVPTKQ